MDRPFHGGDVMCLGRFPDRPLRTLEVRRRHDVGARGEALLETAPVAEPGLRQSFFGFDADRARVDRGVFDALTAETAGASQLDVSHSSSCAPSLDGGGPDRAADAGDLTQGDDIVTRVHANQGREALLAALGVPHAPLELLRRGGPEEAEIARAKRREV